MSLNSASYFIDYFLSSGLRIAPVKPINLVPAWLLKFLLWSRLVLLYLGSGILWYFYTFSPFNCSCIFWRRGEMPSSILLLISASLSLIKHVENIFPNSTGSSPGSSWAKHYIFWISWWVISGRGRLVLQQFWGTWQVLT